MVSPTLSLDQSSVIGSHTKKCGVPLGLALRLMQRSHFGASWRMRKSGNGQFLSDDDQDIAGLRQS
jgi:hypothetical protein